MNAPECTHTIKDKVSGVEISFVDWRDCKDCVDGVYLRLTIAVAYLDELARADFNDNGMCVTPISQPVRGRSYQQIAATGLKASSE